VGLLNYQTMEQLKDQDSAIRFIGKTTALRFICLSDGLATYETVIPKLVSEVYVKIQIEVFYEELTDLIDFCNVEFLTHQRQIFELVIIYSTVAASENIYHKKYIDPSNN
tara:strand:+ start:25 stop:354 length:330 start_codon:yes stop_codon:yes gene_type:complete